MRVAAWKPRLGRETGTPARSRPRWIIRCPHDEGLPPPRVRGDHCSRPEPAFPTPAPPDLPAVGRFARRPTRARHAHRGGRTPENITSLGPPRGRGAGRPVLIACAVPATTVRHDGVAASQEEIVPVHASPPCPPRSTPAWVLTSRECWPGARRFHRALVASASACRAPCAPPSSAPPGRGPRRRHRQGCLPFRSGCTEAGESGCEKRQALLSFWGSSARRRSRAGGHEKARTRSPRVAHPDGEFSAADAARADPGDLQFTLYGDTARRRPHTLRCRPARGEEAEPLVEGWSRRPARPGACTSKPASSGAMMRSRWSTTAVHGLVEAHRVPGAPDTRTQLATPSNETASRNCNVSGTEANVLDHRIGRDLCSGEHIIIEGRPCAQGEKQCRVVARADEARGSQAQLLHRHGSN